MTDFDTNAALSEQSAATGDVPYESIPQLAANERFAMVCEELRRLKQIKDELFEDRIGPDGKKRPSYWDELKVEAAALSAAAGQKSVAFVDLRIAQTEPAAAPMKVTGASMVSAFGAAGAVVTLTEYHAITMAAKELDPNVLVQYGIPAHIVAAARVQAGKPRAGSTRIEWIGKKGTAAGKHGSGGSGSVQ